MDKKIYQALLQVQSELNALGKNQKNSQQGWAFRGVDDVMNMLHPILVKCGVIIIPTVLDVKRTSTTTAKGTVLNYCTTTVKYTFYADDGSSIELTTAGEGMDSGDKSLSKSLSIAYKYAIFQAFCLPTEDDPDKDVYENAPVVNNENIKEMMSVISSWLKTDAEKNILNIEQRNAIEKMRDEQDYVSFSKFKDKIDTLIKNRL
ncbi:ERF family protein [Methanobrevibacter sp.]|uniref:ERF family protein n=1 Tax=Methanobrevibacter sp. TaxID=66852 RepID=UPI00388F7D3E